MLLRCCIQYVSKFGKLNSGHKTGKCKFFVPIPKKGDAKECSNCHTIVLISHISKVMLKILQARLQQYVNWELSDVQVGFRSSRGTRDQIANIHWIMEKVRNQKNIYFYTEVFDCVDHNKLWKTLNEMGIPQHITCLLRNMCADRSNSKNWTWNNGLVQNWERSMSRLYFVILLI